MINDLLKLEFLLLSVGESQDYAAPGTWVPPAAKEIEDAKTSGPVEEEDETTAKRVKYNQFWSFKK